jgi:hypothetical protein
LARATVGEYGQGHTGTDLIQTILTFSCFNAFSRVDMRVEAKIPGGVDAYIVDLRGER